MIRKKQTRTKPAINTSALPDIIFMLLFFFMVVTVMRQQKRMLNIKLPSATEITKLHNHSSIQYIYVGKPIDKERGTADRIQINDAFVPLHKLEAAIRITIAGKPESIKAGWINSLKVDKDVDMGIVSDVKTALRKAEQLKLNYEVIADNGN
ncbi:MAG: biopolymer transport protein ExbD [Polaribacter sp.]|jgi:biopolymer transport protein ExbD